MGMSLYSFKYNISNVNVIFMKNRRFYEINVSYSNNSVVFYSLLNLLVNNYYPLVSSHLISAPLGSSPLCSFLLILDPLLSTPLLSSPPLHSTPLRSDFLRSSLFGSTPPLSPLLRSSPLWGGTKTISGM